jgi:sterol desaturase/sphingolipid hydroxylase (fatty acid hydroxylase superfamily)
MWTILSCVIALYLVFAALDAVSPGREQVRIRLWRTRGALAFTVYYGVAFTAPMLWDAALSEHTIFDASDLALWAQIVLGFLTLQALVYAWHRTMHTVSPIWRLLHQMHHSAERVDIWGAFWFHPLDMVGWSLVGSLALVGGVGVELSAAIVISVLASFCSMFQHANLRTPRWLGYLITRPESHSVHHQRGVHRYNYGDVPWFDMLFGTFRNPDQAPSQAGFFDGGSNRILSLLVGREIA